jgi:gluconate 2-dehydrogenase gamma chain
MWILQEQKTGFFNQSQLLQLSVLFNCLFPGSKDRKIPNAEEAGAVNFLHLLLAREESVFDEILKWKTNYPKWLSCLNVQSLELFKSELQSLTSEQATLLMEKLEEAKLVNFNFEELPLDQKSVFDTLRRHCIQGCFSDIRWGGNTNNIMWQAYGYQEDLK